MAAHRAGSLLLHALAPLLGQRTRQVVVTATIRTIDKTANEAIRPSRQRVAQDDSPKQALAFDRAFIDLNQIAGERAPQRYSCRCLTMSIRFAARYVLSRFRRWCF